MYNYKNRAKQQIEKEKEVSFRGTKLYFDFICSGLYQCCPLKKIKNKGVNKVV